MQHEYTSKHESTLWNRDLPSRNHIILDMYLPINRWTTLPFTFCMRFRLSKSMSNRPNSFSFMNDRQNEDTFITVSCFMNLEIAFPLGHFVLPSMKHSDKSGISFFVAGNEVKKPVTLVPECRFAVAEAPLTMTNTTFGLTNWPFRYAVPPFCQSNGRVSRHQGRKSRFSAPFSSLRE